MMCACATSWPATSAMVAQRQMPLTLRSKLRLQDQLVAGLDGPAKARLVDADEVEARGVIGQLIGGQECQQAGHLRQGFDDDHARHDRPVREMAR